MVNIQYSIILAFMGQMRDRSATYQEPRGLAERLALASRIEGARGVEPGYLLDFQGVNPEAFKGLLAQNGLTVSSVNVNTRSEPKSHLGALTWNELMIEVMRWPEPLIQVVSEEILPR